MLFERYPLPLKQTKTTKKIKLLHLERSCKGNKNSFSAKWRYKNKRDETELVPIKMWMRATLTTLKIAPKIEVHTDSGCSKEKKAMPVCKRDANNRNLYLGDRSRVDVF